jgi:hypothetical protein
MAGWRPRFATPPLTLHPMSYLFLVCAVLLVLLARLRAGRGAIRHSG